MEKLKTMKETLQDNAIIMKSIWENDPKFRKQCYKAWTASFIGGYCLATILEVVGEIRKGG